MRSSSTAQAWVAAKYAQKYPDRVSGMILLNPYASNETYSKRIEEATHEDGMGVLAITHYSRLFEQLKPDVVHVFADGRIQYPERCW